MNFQRRLKYLFPVPLKKVLKYLYYLCQDIGDFMTGRTLKGYPPKRLNFVGSSSFKKVGDEFAEYFIKLGKLQPSDTVLDIGCGIGRMAIPLTRYVTDGAYYGFDIDRRGILWSQKNISKKFPHFHFQYVDIFNQYYNKKGKIKAEEFIFPYEEKTFDFVFATSVFTHMLPEQIRQYLMEIKRVLKPGGTSFLTWFSIDKEARKNIGDHISSCDFSYEYNAHCFYSHKNCPEAEIGYQEHWIIEQLKKLGGTESSEIHHGSWSQRQEYLSYQDIFITRISRHSAAG